jgi:hypothetical protein
MPLLMLRELVYKLKLGLNSLYSPEVSEVFQFEPKCLKISNVTPLMFQKISIQTFRY